MFFFELILALWWLWLPLLVIWFILSRNKSGVAKSPTQSSDLQWHNYILSFKDIVRTKAEKNLIQALLERRTADQLYQQGIAPLAEIPEDTRKTTTGPGSPHSVAAGASTRQVNAPPAAKPIDNTLLLLYFGAFLLIAAAGLFVAIGTLSGGLRTALLATTSIFLYGSGIWIFKTKKKLAQAGISFVAVGMMIAPLVGVAWYNLIAEQSDGAIIWLITSLVSLGLYFHAYRVVRNGFVSYLLIGSFVSTVLSAVLTVELPIYVFAWVAIACALLLRFIKNLRSQPSDKSFFEASDQSAQVLVPLSFLSSLLLLPEFGNLQLAVTLLLTSSYYALMAWEKPKDRSAYATASQLSVVAAAANLSYMVNDQLSDSALVVGIIALLYSFAIALAKPSKITEYGLVACGVIAAAGSILLSIGNPWPLVWYIGIGIVLSAVVWLKLRYKSYLVIGGILLLLVPYLIGQYAMEPKADARLQLILFGVATAILWAISVYSSLTSRFKDNYEPSAYLFITGALFSVITGWISGFNELLILCLALCVAFAGLERSSKENGWWVFAGVFAFIPLLFALLTYGIDDERFVLANVFALAVNIIISLLTREKAIRAFVVVAILFAPLAVGGGGLGFVWQEAGYAFGYMLAMAGCVLARAIARGKVLVSSKVPVSSYDKNASEVYVFGYTIAGATALFISLFDENSRIVTSLVLGILILALLGISRYIESNLSAFPLLPLLVQALLFSALRPDINDPEQIGIAAIASALLGAVCYGFMSYLTVSPQLKQLVLSTAVISAYVGPALIVFGAEISELLPIALALAGGLTLYHNRNAAQYTRELSIGVIIAALHWLLYHLGVENIQIHTHVLAIFLAGFAYWRYLLNDRETSHNYIVALFLVATVPLALEALSNESGDNYGLLLIVQQVAFMVIGVALNIRFLLKAGLWVALAAVLYQLRGLGWAFLAIIAMVLIGIAIYRLQKHSDQ